MTSETLTPQMTDGASPQQTSPPPPRLATQMVPARQVNARPSHFHTMKTPQRVTRDLVQDIALEIDGWNRKMAATLAHLKNAYDLIELANHHIAAQQSRIAMLEDLATTDDLTGLKNRRGFYEIFEREIERCNRKTSKGGLLVMIDLDNFKAINDRYGHPAGDSALKLVARTLDQEIRKIDTAVRLGGDEFILLLANTTKAEAAARAQNIVWKLNNLSMAWYGDVIPVQASVGLKSFGAGDQAASILRDADGTLYACKTARKAETKSPSCGGTTKKCP